MLLVTGASGFVGRNVIAAASNQPTFAVRAAVRRAGAHVTMPDSVPVGDIDGRTDWSVALAGVKVVVHAAARVHVMRDREADPLAAFRRVNVDGTLNLARQAAAGGVRRFVFISSIKVNGEETAPGRPYTPDDVPAPCDPYGVSKLEAEQGLRALARTGGMDVVVVRPVLVYGPGVKGNFRTMVRFVRRHVPLPFGGVHNRRSLVAVETLADLILTCTVHPAAANETFLVSDGEDVSTADLLRRIGTAFGTPAHLLPVPQSAIVGALRLAGKGTVARRLCGSLQVDISKTCRLLDWSPLLSLDEALSRLATAGLD